MSFTRTGSGRPLQTNRQEDRHIVRNARIQFTASSADIQAQVPPSLGTSVSSGTYEGSYFLCCPGSPPIDASVWSGDPQKETGLQRNGTGSTSAMNPESISAVMTIVFVCGN
ncbi:uncharacterized protein TNCV_2241191 [Trichonephila clavipes]|nr:uncharacterized protein TNCV_2241191 [Trichonephila clavipes]